MSYVFKNPCIRSGAEIIDDGDLVITYAENEFALEFDQDEQKRKFVTIFDLLRGAHSLNELQEKRKQKGISDQEWLEAIEQLDGCSLLSEARVEGAEMRGIDLAFHMEDLYHNHWKPALGETPLTTLFLDGQPSRDIMVGWSMEYYSVTRMAHDAIIGAVPFMHGPLKSAAMHFYNEEYRHDKLMQRSLEALGYDQSQTTDLVPLPATQLLINLLSHWGKTDPLSFMCSLFVYEGEVADYSPYIDALRASGLPEEFIEGQEVHNNINVTGGHGNEHREFLDDVPLVSESDVERVTDNLKMLVQVEHLVHQQILDYYGNPQIGIPRRLD